MRGERRYKGTQPDQQLGDARGEFRKDHDRLYYTPAFRRLTGITQVAAPQAEIAPIHNRYIHSDKVGQTGRAISEFLLDRTDEALVEASGGLSPDVVGAAGLAHDIGHPPFGHAGEMVLNRWALDQGLDGFEGNAQTFRVLTKLAVKDETFPGLDLTRATRNAVLKYPWLYGEGPGTDLAERHRRKWSVYRSEQPDFNEARSIHTVGPSPDGEASQSVEATIMELADDISYALHDFEDFYRVGLISIPALLAVSDDNDGIKKTILNAVQRALRGRFEFALAEDAWESAMNWLKIGVFRSLRSDYDGSVEQDAALVRLTSLQISRFVDGVSLAAGGHHPVLVQPLIEHEIAIWKQLTWQFVINRPDFGAAQHGQSQMIGQTVEAVAEWADTEGVDSPRLPRRLRDYYSQGTLDQDSPDYPNPRHDLVIARAVLDYIASLTEPQMVALHDRLCGSWRGSMIAGTVI